MAKARHLVALVLFSFLVACGTSELPGRIYVLAVGAVPEDAFRNREVEVSPLLLGPGLPRMADGTLDLPRREGLTISEGDGSERGGPMAAGPATAFFTLPDTLSPGRYRVGVFLSLGERFGQMDRGDTWWRVEVDCLEECQVVQVEESSRGEWEGVMEGRP
ncbi:hypothetical protein ACFL3S_08315 [Gemmatimonadota bacterium]